MRHNVRWNGRKETRVSDPNRDVTAQDIAVVVAGFVCIGAGIYLLGRAPIWLGLALAVSGGYLTRPLWWFWD